MLDKCDRIAVLSNNIISEIGGYNELLERQGPFYELIEKFINSKKNEMSEKERKEKEDKERGDLSASLGKSLEIVNDEFLLSGNNKKDEKEKGKLISNEKMAKGMPSY
jgi:hypothetical protein